MSRDDWESVLRQWAEPFSSSELAVCQWAVEAASEAVASSATFRKRDIRTLMIGSYRNSTNVRNNSDVDIGIVCYDAFIEGGELDGTAKEPPSPFVKENSSSDDGAIPYEAAKANYAYGEFKNEVGRVLVEHFGRQAVVRGNKAFKVRVGEAIDADVVPFMEHRRFDVTANAIGILADGGWAPVTQYLRGRNPYVSGVELRPDDDPERRVVNWPEQHFNNGAEKERRAGNYKSTVRALKALGDAMLRSGFARTKRMPGFLVECLVYNAPNPCFDKLWSYDTVLATLQFIRNELADELGCWRSWGEVSELKYLFRDAQPWTRASVHQWVSDALVLLKRPPEVWVVSGE